MSEEENRVSIYGRFDRLNFSALYGKPDTWPKRKTYTVNLGGIEFTVKTNYLAPHVGGTYDAYEAIASMHSGSRSTMDGPVTRPEFDTEALSRLNLEQKNRRNDFVRAVANLIDDQETMEAIVAAAPKKKNGTLCVKRLVRIASSASAYFKDCLPALAGKIVSDREIDIKVYELTCSPGDNEKWDEDFVSTRHPGLPIDDFIQALTT